MQSTKLYTTFDEVSAHCMALPGQLFSRHVIGLYPTGDIVVRTHKQPNRNLYLRRESFCVQILSPLLPSGEANKLKDEIGVKKMVRAESISYQERFTRCCITHSGDAFGSPGALRGSKTQGQSQPWRGRPRSCDCHVIYFDVVTWLTTHFQVDFSSLSLTLANHVLCVGVVFCAQYALDKEITRVNWTLIRMYVYVMMNFCHLFCREFPFLAAWQ